MFSHWHLSHHAEILARTARVLSGSALDDPVAFTAARDHGLWVCLTVIGGAYAIDAAGQVYGLAEHQPQPVRLSPTDPWFWTVLIRLSREPVFADLRPARPTTAMTCPACAGAGEIGVSAQARLGCGQCLGLGWVQPGRQITELLAELSGCAVSPTPIPDLDRYQACLLAPALADAAGAPYEGGWLERGLWRLIGHTRDGLPRWTDDTAMTLDVAQVLLQHGHIDQDALAQQFAASYHWSRGYGPGAARLLKRIRRGQPWRSANRAVFAQGSYGNGAAMRVAPLALRWVGDRAQLLTQTRLSAEVTHAHPLAISGAQFMALAIRAALLGLQGADFWAELHLPDAAPVWADKLATAQQWLAQAQPPRLAQVAQQLGHGITAIDAVPCAIYLGCRYAGADFDTLLQAARTLGGDVDTIGAMAAALWGARRGVADLLQRPLEQRERVLALAAALYRAGVARVGDS